MFDNLIGQETAVKLLQQAVNCDRVAPAYLFAGMSGVGRSIAAQNFARLLLLKGLASEQHSLATKKILANNHPDLLWVKPTYLSKGQLYTAQEAIEQGLNYQTPPKIRIEQIRGITQFLQRPILEATRKVVVIAEAQTMAEASANALLKTLEEPGNATLILIAPSPDALLSTLVSRCQRIQFSGLSSTNLGKVLEREGYLEIMQHPELIAISQGSPGKAIAAWQQLQTIPNELLQQLTRSISSSLTAMILAQTITKELDLNTQLWLVDYLQQYHWQNNPQIPLIRSWETTRKQLLSYVQPRLVWECALLNCYHATN